MLNYGFCFPNNSYDSFSISMCTDFDSDKLYVPDMVDLKYLNLNSQEIRLKIDQINEVLVAYLRAACKVKFFKSSDVSNEKT